MNRKRELSQEAFNKLLEWLDSERETAGEKYEAIRRRLIKIFTCRGCSEAEDLADETINRVTLKVAAVAQTYSGDPALYFYGVAQKVHLEYLRKIKTSPPPAAPQNNSGIEQEYDCLERCMERLSPNNRELVIRYYREDKKAKIDNRRQLAHELGIALNALRIRAYRIRLELHQCVQHCLQQEPAC